MAQPVKKLANTVIAYSFTVGVVIALVLGLVSGLVTQWVPALTSLLILAGVVVGFFNITPAETKDYVLFVTAVVIVISLGGNTLGQVQYVGDYLSRILTSILAFILPSVIIVAIKAIINLARN
ncbi:TPA: hypothetical protein HA242_00930 [Candidatus Woesearchaeota archaeon]|nr:hypothetical protein [Candidatus Woesearchaeota archaeon]HIH12263.1 hypothetical protein [Candidatus Woesearchaeota archaeon]